ncbi:Fe-S cluster assembly protein SufD [Hydrotalea sandarakina]|jgi:Fe-S cluster assembly protein SufD|uniref:Fe-S cluster assembly protein SufD n=1 Tax=Hydrotalea sandarakina TaxID=1004304 RepID=A0A2W7RQ99_9BACT|nr:Fe-S cluster assembly protein SufD [Hydrotalea sandarakina]PZX60690.1 Fe-S cluster assembly protein SufD [Hydrotalea sandarakina]
MAISESAYIQEKFSALQTQQADAVLNEIRLKAFENFQVNGIPSYKNEEWRYTPVSQLFKKPFELSENTVSIEQQFLQQTRLPNSNEANELIFVNGVYDASLSNIRSKELVVLPLEKALSDSTYAELVKAHLGKSSLYIKDGVHALNTSFINGGVFVYVPKNAQIDLPFYVYHLCNTQKNPVLAQPRSLVYISESASLKIVEHYATIGNTDSFINEVMEVVVAENAQFEYYKLQADVANANQVNTTHIRQIGKSFVHTVVATLTGGMLRNNTNIIMEKAGNEAHMYGLYLLNGSTHADNHTLVDNREPNCFSNELYKGILDGSSTGVFSGKIYVRPQAQKTNAYQSNKNILLSDNASVNTKPQLEIFADDVKCSHGCTVGRLDEEALFYLRSRGIDAAQAKAMLLLAFANDVIDKINIESLREHIEDIIVNRLAVQTS